MKLKKRIRIQKTIAIHWYKSKWWAATPVSTLKVTKKITNKIRSNLHTGQYASSNFSDHIQDRRWWSHWCSLGSPKIPTSFFARPLKKWLWTSHIHQWSQLQLVESDNCFRSHGIFSILQPQALLLQSLPVWHCLCSSPKQMCQQLLHPILVLQTLRWHCIECVIHHKQDVCEE